MSDGIEITPSNAKPPVRISPASEPKPVSFGDSGALARGAGDRTKPTSTPSLGWWKKDSGVGYSKY